MQSALFAVHTIAASPFLGHDSSHRKSDKVALTLVLSATCESRRAKCSWMLDHESIIIQATQIDGQSYPDDYTVIWRGLPIGRIRKNPGLPAHVDQWSWGCNVYGQPSVSGDSGQGTDPEDCRAKFKAAWARVRARLTGADVAKAREEKRQRRIENQERDSALGVGGRAGGTGWPPGGSI
jgi:hypothetical protein